MKIAYLILCHKNPHQVERLIKQLNTDNTDFYLHVDKKVRDFKITARNNVYYVPESNRIDVQWASMSMIYATMMLIKTALKSQKEYDFIFLLSGQDFPIKSNKYISDFLENNKGSDFIQILSHSDPMYIRYSKRNAIYYPDWMFSQNTYVRILRKLYIYVTGGYKHTFKLFRRKQNNSIVYEYGSQWWGLRKESLSWIYDFLKKKENLTRLFSNSLTPDECVFQTAYMLSPYKTKHQDKVVFLDWATNMNNPRILTRDDLKLLITDKGNLFARKFDESVDSTILDCLEKRINS